MATRSTIEIEWVNFAKIYKHWDWHPDNMLEPLTKFNKYYIDWRWFDDPEYKFAQLLRKSKEILWDYDDFTWWWVVEYDWADEEYNYILHKSWAVSYT